MIWKLSFHFVFQMNALYFCNRLLESKKMWSLWSHGNSITNRNQLLDYATSYIDWDKIQVLQKLSLIGAAMTARWTSKLNPAYSLMISFPDECSAEFTVIQGQNIRIFVYSPAELLSLKCNSFTSLLIRQCKWEIIGIGQLAEITPLRIETTLEMNKQM